MNVNRQFRPGAQHFVTRRAATRLVSGLVRAAQQRAQQSLIMALLDAEFADREATLQFKEAGRRRAKLQLKAARRAAKKGATP